MTAPRELVLTLDIGTSSVRALLYGVDAQPLPGTEARVTYEPSLGADGRTELDATWLATQCRTVLAGAIGHAGRSDRIAAVGVSSFWHGLLGLDRSRRPATPIVLWSDQRSWRQATALRGEGALGDVRQRTGAPIHPSYWPAKLAWAREQQPSWWRRVRHWVSFADYLYLQLFGELGTSASMASGTGLRRLDDGRWDARLLERLQLDAAALPERREVFQGLRQGVDDVRGAAGAVWLSARGDGGLATIGSDCERDGRRALTIGTSAALRATLGAPPRHLEAGLWCYLSDRTAHVIGGSFSNGGNLHAWLLHQLRLEGDVLERELRRLPPASTSLTFLPLLAGERSPGFAPRAAGSVSGLTEGTTALDLARAGMEGVAMLLRPVDQALDVVTGEPGRAVVNGGALVQSGAWCQVIADALGKPVSAVAAEEASSRGAAVVALRELEAPAPPRLRLVRTWRPRASAHEVYDAASERLRELYEATIENPGRV
ncbi:MAG: FGGY family carbohydrate kinase [Candidatus Dormiibacterota bacterium]